MHSGGARERPVGRIGVENAPVGVSYHDAFVGMFEHLLEYPVRRLPARNPQHPGRKRKQGENPDHAENGQQEHHIGTGLIAADQHETRGSGNQAGGDQQHQRNAAPAFVALSHGRAQALHCHDGPRIKPALAREDLVFPLAPSLPSPACGGG